MVSFIIDIYNIAIYIYIYIKLENEKHYRLRMNSITMNSLQLQRDSNGSDKLSNKTIVIPNKLTTIADSFRGEHSWYNCKIPFFFMD